MFERHFVSSRQRGEAHVRERLPALQAALDTHFGGRHWASRAGP
ncbi:MAG: hypothetical protein ACK58U_10530 [Rubrivivax sp.]|jgi:hypothetical protein